MNEDNAKLLIIESTVIRARAERIKDELGRLILDLPDNPEIKRLSSNPNCYIINSSVINKDLHHTLSPEYYDFKYQYKKLVEKIDTMNILQFSDNLKKIINDGKFNVGSNNEVIKLHPKVIELLLDTFYADM